MASYPLCPDCYNVPEPGQAVAPVRYPLSVFRVGLETVLWFPIFRPTQIRSDPPLGYPVSNS